MSPLGLQLGLGIGSGGRAKVPAAGLPFGSDPTSGAYVTAQWNFHDKTTSDLSGGLLDETGNWTMSFHAEAAINAEGYLYRNGTPDGSNLAFITAADNADFSVLETVAGGAFGYGLASLIMRIPSAQTVSKNILNWYASSGANRWGFVIYYDGANTFEGSALTADGVGGANTSLQNLLNAIPEDGTKFIINLSGADNAANPIQRINFEDELGGNQVASSTNEERTARAAGAATHSFIIADWFQFKAIRIARDHASDGLSLIGAGVDGTSNGFPALT